MKIVVYLLVVSGLIYYVMTHHSPFQTEATDPYFVEIRLDIKESDVQLVGVGKMFSLEDCQARAALVWMDTLKHLGQVRVSSNCKKDLPKKYLKLFDNKKSSASYVAFDRGEGGERDARFLFYGIPSSYVYKECETLTKKAKESYSGDIYCVQGTVG
ncbi:MAG: hypothetical protein KZQ73_00040 [Candidatus Thiodiazotropha sp. (ex Semelilucina semeliformis)]|nr:hypothetical protein [Candidatus Thiodiazotropha sp. (ex Semelilucina semeliformis)]